MRAHEQAIRRHNVVLFMRPDCQFCDVAERTLGVALAQVAQSPGCNRPTAAIVSLDSEQDRIAMMERTGSQTLPAVFVDREFVGGAQETVALARSGVLVARLRALVGCGS